MKTRSIVLLAANLGNAIFFGFILLRMLLWGGTLHQATLVEPSTVIIWGETIAINCLIFCNAAWLIHAIRTSRETEHPVAVNL